jgi:hypothetical protein
VCREMKNFLPKRSIIRYGSYHSSDIDIFKFMLVSTYNFGYYSGLVIRILSDKQIYSLSVRKVTLFKMEMVSMRESHLN